jgi:hypothetical protein
MPLIDGLSVGGVLFPAFVVQPEIAAAFDGVLHGSAFHPQHRDDDAEDVCKDVLTPSTTELDTAEMPPAFDCRCAALIFRNSDRAR